MAEGTPFSSHAVDAAAVNSTILRLKSRATRYKCTDRCKWESHGQAFRQTSHEPLSYDDGKTRRSLGDLAALTTEPVKEKHDDAHNVTASEDLFTALAHAVHQDYMLWL